MKTSTKFGKTKAFKKKNLKKRGEGGKNNGKKRRGKNPKETRAPLATVNCHVVGGRGLF